MLPARTATDIMASFEKTPPQTTASAVGLLRKLARDEQKKLSHLRATNGAENDIAAAETRVRDLTAKLSAAASVGGGAAARARQVGGDGGEVRSAGEDAQWPGPLTWLRWQSRSRPALWREMAALAVRRRWRS